jgi:predicted TIM-barrel fold metal-dependent hydrolase
MNDTERVRRFWGDLGLPGIIDVHTHFMPEEVMRKVWAYFDSAGPLTGVRWPISYRQGAQERLDTLRSFGVRAFTALVYPHKPDMAQWLNEWAASFADRTPDCLRTATFFAEPTAAQYVPQAIADGARIFKVHIQVGDFSPDDPVLRPVWGSLEDSGTPVLIHCGSGPAPGRFTGPAPIHALLRRFPRLNLIIAHLGMPECGEFLDLAARFPEIRLDTTMAFTDFIQDLAPAAAPDRAQLRDLSDRILFGSDFPNIPYAYDHALAALARLELGDDWLRSVCYINAHKLFHTP